MHLRTFLSPISPKPIKETKEISKAKQPQNITPNRILKKGSIENLDDFLKTTEKIIGKKRRLAITFKQKLNIGKQNSKTAVINILGNLGKKELPNSTLALTFRKSVEDVTMIGVDAYCLACQLKEAQVFAISIRDVEV